MKKIIKDFSEIKWNEISRYDQWSLCTGLCVDDSGRRVIPESYYHILNSFYGEDGELNFVQYPLPALLSVWIGDKVKGGRGELIKQFKDLLQIGEPE